MSDFPSLRFMLMPTGTIHVFDRQTAMFLTSIRPGKSVELGGKTISYDEALALTHEDE